MNEHHQRACVLGTVEESFELLAGADIDADRVEVRIFVAAVCRDRSLLWWLLLALVALVVVLLLNEPVIA